MKFNDFSLTDNIYILGTGGFAKEILVCILDVIKKNNLNYDWQKNILFVQKEGEESNTMLGCKIVNESKINFENSKIICGVGDPILREKVITKLPKNANYLTLVHPSTTISQFVKLNIGCIVMAGSVLTVDIQVGKHAHINLNTTIGHDCVIGDYFTTAPGVNLSGNCTIGNKVYLGSNASIKQGVEITSNVTIGMGAVVTKSIHESATYIGNPLKILEK